MGVEDTVQSFYMVASYEKCSVRACRSVGREEEVVKRSVIEVYRGMTFEMIRHVEWLYNSVFCLSF